MKPRCYRNNDFLVYTEEAKEQHRLVEALLPDPDRLLEGAEVFPGRGRCCLTARIRIDDTDYVVKRYEYRGLWYGARHIFKRSRALRVFINQHIARQTGVDIPEPLLCLEERTARFLRRCYVLSRYIPQSRTLDELWDELSVDDRSCILSRCGEIYRKIHAVGIIHGDSNWRNILLTDDVREKRIYLIDFDNSRRPGLAGQRRCRKDIAHFLRDMKFRELSEASVHQFLSAWGGQP